MHARLSQQPECEWRIDFDRKCGVSRPAVRFDGAPRAARRDGPSPAQARSGRVSSRDSQAEPSERRAAGGTKDSSSGLSPNARLRTACAAERLSDTPAFFHQQKRPRRQPRLRLAPLLRLVDPRAPLSQPPQPQQASRAYHTLPAQLARHLSRPRSTRCASPTSSFLLNNELACASRMRCMTDEVSGVCPAWPAVPSSISHPQSQPRQTRTTTSQPHQRPRDLRQWSTWASMERTGWMVDRLAATAWCLLVGVDESIAPEGPSPASLRLGMRATLNKTTATSSNQPRLGSNIIHKLY